MKHRIETLRFWLVPLTFLGMCGWVALGAVMKPSISDLLDVRRIEVVALTDPVERDGCVIAGHIQHPIAAGDALYVRADITFLQAARERYRTWLRRTDRSRNIFDTDWSAQFSIPAGATYCPYEPLGWWVGREVGPLPPGIYRLFTEYEMTADNGLAVTEVFSSEPFIVEE